MNSKPLVQPWQQTASKRVGDFRVFTVRSDVKISPRNGSEHDFFVIESVNWVNVVAITTDDHLVMIDQYRHGTNTVELEIPGGMMDAGETSPILAGLRELQEETGYTGEGAELLGQIYPNPAIMSNTCYTVLVRNCQRTHDLELDPSEDLAVRLVPMKEIPELVRAGKIGHSLVVVALYYYDLWKRAQAV